MKHKPHYQNSTDMVAYQKAKVKAHYDKLCEIIESQMCSTRDIQMYFEDKQFKRYYHNRKKNGEGTL
jgi:hypothetical protein